MYYGAGLETRTFEDAANDEIGGRIAGIPQGRHYLSLSLYYEAIKKYQKAFGVANVHVTLYDHLRDRPAGFMESLFTFLGVDATFAPNLDVRRNTAKEWLGTKETPALTVRARERCKEFFEKELAQLQDIIDIGEAGWV
jgi:hypothetical protein